MCLILFAYKAHPQYRLILAANRDEFYDRPTQHAGWWDSNPDLLAGRDLKAGGSWLGITRNGYFAALTNYRDPGQMRTDASSRGELVSAYLQNGGDPQAYMEDLKDRGHRYNGFNLLVSDQNSLWYYSNMGAGPTELEPGVYGLSNHLLDTPWPKVQKGVAGLNYLINDHALNLDSVFTLLADPARATDDHLPQTGVGLELERLLSPVFIQSPRYGTRASTVLLVDETGQVTFEERSFIPPVNGAFHFRIGAGKKVESA
jgi:uncharacterized protein with NRDE domain